MPITASAPGKIVLLGEYAVLTGAPALVMAVDRRADVELTANHRQYSRLTAPGYSNHELRFTFAGEAPQWSGLEACEHKYDLAVRVIDDILAAAIGRAAPHFDLVLRTDAFFAVLGGSGGRTKLGLGSSAALTVALASAVAGHLGWDYAANMEAWMSRLWSIHRGFQGGYGSGLDIAAAIHGGVIEYRLSSVSGAPRVSRLEPLTLPGVFVWTGTGASTPELVGRFEAWRASAPRQFARVSNALRAISKAGIGAFRNREIAGFIAAMGEYANTLEILGERAGIEIFSPAHRRLLDLARDCGAVYKPCGAGGGDIGIVLHPDASALQAFIERAEPLGYARLKMGIDEQGLETIRRQT